MDLYDLTEGEVVPERFDSFSRGLITVDDDFKVSIVADSFKLRESEAQIAFKVMLDRQHSCM